MDDEPPPASLLLHVLELGAGMAGLAGMALSIQNPRHTRVVLTDGHPDAVRNNRVNILLTQALYPSCVHLDITAQRLLWTTTTQQQHDDDDDNDSTIPNNTELFDLVLASDCTHFQEFHASLALTTAHQLRIGGVAIFLAPPRGDSLERFVALCQSLNGLFDVHWLKDGDDDYSETLSKLHHHHYHQNQKNGKPPYYNANIHCPHLLILRKRRCVEESYRHYALLLLHNT
jgi:calmodulin-lysine N-methyltransferase